MSKYLEEELIDNFCLDMVPPVWAKVAYPSERSLGGWFNDLVQVLSLLALLSFLRRIRQSDR